jgi:solute carrier family 50 protein (sugar transporter)
MGSPLSSLKNVIETRSTESMPFSTSLMAFLNSMCWSLYGLLIANEAVIYVPNLIGLAMTSVQMGLFMLYGVHGGYKTVNSLPISGNSIIDDAE